jgi:hypothetical protein
VSLTGHRFAAVKPHISYGILTEAIVEEICDQRILTADLLKRSKDAETAWAAKLVLDTVQAIRIQLMGIIE